MIVQFFYRLQLHLTEDTAADLFIIKNKMTLRKTKVPRRLKKRIKNAMLMIDLSSIPKCFTLDEIMYEYKNAGIILWDDERGSKPTFSSDKRPK